MGLLLNLSYASHSFYDILYPILSLNSEEYAPRFGQYYSWNRWSEYRFGGVALVLITWRV